MKSSHSFITKSSLSVDMCTSESKKKRRHNNDNDKDKDESNIIGREKIGLPQVKLLNKQTNTQTHYTAIQYDTIQYNK